MSVKYGAVYAAFDKENRTFLNTMTGFTDCAYYDRWRNMMTRVYGNYEKTRKSYENVECSPSFLNFFNFKFWIDKEPFSNYTVSGNPYQLDKDLLGFGRKYSEDTCAFIPAWLNSAIPRANQKSDKETVYVSVKRESESKTTYTCFLKTENGGGKFVGGFTDPIVANKFAILIKAKIMQYIGENIEGLVKPEVIDMLLNFDSWLIESGFNYDPNFKHHRLDEVLLWYKKHYDIIMEDAKSSTKIVKHIDNCEFCKSSVARMQRISEISGV